MQWMEGWSVEGGAEGRHRGRGGGWRAGGVEEGWRGVETRTEGWRGGGVEGLRSEVELRFFNVRSKLHLYLAALHLPKTFTVQLEPPALA